MKTPSEDNDLASDAKGSHKAAFPSETEEPSLLECGQFIAAAAMAIV
jgi:hypothetical protein